MKKLKYIACFLGLLIMIVLTSACKKLIEINAPTDGTNAQNVYAEDAMAASVLTGLYAKLAQGNSVSGYGFNTGGDFTSISVIAGLSSDELNLFDLSNLGYFTFYSNTLTSNYTGTGNYWSIIYPYIFTTNSAIEGLNRSTTLTPAVRQQLLGEAKFMRAFFYFYLTNLYGDVPLAISPNFKVNSSLARTPISSVYEQIAKDLVEAQSLLNTNYLNSDLLTSTTARIRPNKWVATALLSRVYLYMKKFPEAEAEATKLISNSTFQLAPLNSVFLKNSSEAIWQLQNVGSGTDSNTGDAKFFILPSTGPSSVFPIYLNPILINSFEPGDLRKTNWINSVTPTPSSTKYYYAYKYKVGATPSSSQEYLTVFRLAEQFLIRAEAETQQNKNAAAISDLDVLRARAALPLVATTNPTINQDALLDKIYHERQTELFTEFGQRWFDLKRRNTANVIMPAVTITKNGTWESTDQLYPIPKDELLKAPQIVQNPGY